MQRFRTGRDELLLGLPFTLLVSQFLAVRFQGEVCLVEQAPLPLTVGNFTCQLFGFQPSLVAYLIQVSTGIVNQLSGRKELGRQGVPFRTDDGQADFKSIG